MKCNNPKVIIHADDLGLSKNINLGIAEAFDDGILTSTSIMANGKAFDEAVKIVKDRPDLDLGIHLCLIEEFPISEPSEIPTLVNSRGTLPQSALNFVSQYLTRRLSLDEIALEIKNQFNKVFAAGLNISHIDSHQHIHILPAIYKLIKNLAEEYNINFIRIPYQRTSAFMLKRFKAKRFLELIVLQRFCRQLRTSNDLQFFGFYNGGELNHRNLAQILKLSSSHEISEIMCHPGRKSQSYLHWGYNHQSELDALTSPVSLDIVKRLNLDLVGFKHI